ncbi:MAG: FAD-dependent oxidoreductase [Chloroflexi bacterium]|nr:FAD-dependent oxidoreductase [Chloroflexota bacterium]
MTAFPKLFEPFSIGKVRLKNRIVMLPMGTAYANAIGEVTQKTIDHFVERAKGGVGLVIVGNGSPFGRINLNQLVIDADWFMAGHYELVEQVHTEGTPIAIQLNHPGRQTYPWVFGGKQAVSSSDVPCSKLPNQPRPRPLETEEIYDIMDKWAEAAGRAKKVGYDMVELHAANGHLVEQFMSPAINKRTDEFGGSLQNRMRFPLELLRRVRKVVGESYPIGFRFGAEEFNDEGITIRESPLMAKILADAGAAYLNVTCGTWETSDKSVYLMRQPEGWQAYIWEAVKKAVDIPVIAGGSLKSPGYCQSLIIQGKGDLVGLGRPLLADPHWANKAREGRTEDICPCISCIECMQGSANRRQGGGNRRCSVNAAAGREGEFTELKPAPVKKKVLVVGGGPGGMEAARVAALRGHDVTLYEKGNELGGALRLAAVPPGKDKIGWYLSYLRTQVAKAGVKVKLGAEATPQLVAREKPDAVVVATGSTPVRPPAFAGNGVLMAWDVLGGKAEVKGDKAVVVGGGMVGLETAEYLAHKGKGVTVVEMLGSLAPDMEKMNRASLLQSLKTTGVVTMTRHKVVDVGEAGVVAEDKNGQKVPIEGEVVLALGATPNRELAEAIEGKAPEVYSIGDCNTTRIIMEAVYEGAGVGRRI